MSRVAVVQGGPSSEAEVSRASARGVTPALEAAGHQVVVVELGPTLSADLFAARCDVVFPVVHGALGEDGCLQGLLEVMGLPYVGSGVRASALAMHKPTARVVFEAAGCVIPRGVSQARGDARSFVARARDLLGPAVVVKPGASGSALGVQRFDAAADDEAVVAAVHAAWELDDEVLVEELVDGREVTCSVLDDGSAEGGTSQRSVDGSAGPAGPMVLAATEIVSPSDPFYTFEARYTPHRSVHTCPADLGPRLTREVHEAAKTAHVALGCRDLSRVDFMVTDRAVLLEVNTLPGMTATSLYPEAARAAGMAFPELCDRLVASALRRARGRASRPRPRAFPG